MNETDLAAAGCAAEAAVGAEGLASARVRSSVGRIGELLELIDSAHARVSTFQAEFQDWKRPRPTTEVVFEGNDLPGRGLHWRGGGPWPRQLLTARRLWAQAPTKLRVELLDAGKLVLMGVRREAQWWRWDASGGAITGELGTSAAGPLLPPVLDPTLLNPVALLPAMRLEPAGFGMRAGRKVFLARAQARQPWRSRWTRRFEFEFDAEHGTLLRRATFEDGHCLEVTEAIHVRYNAQIKAENFVFVAPDGQPARPAGLPATTSGSQDLDPGETAAAPIAPLRAT